MDRNVQKTGLVNLVSMVGVTVCLIMVALYAGSYTGRVTLLFAVLASLIAIVSYFQMRLEEREQLEQLEVDELSRSSKSSALFEGNEAEILPAKRARTQFERVMVPVFTVLLFLIEAIGCWMLNGFLRPDIILPIRDAMMSMSLFAMFGLALFLLGKYSAGLARLHSDRLLRPTASFMLLNAYLLFGVTAAIAGVQAGFENADVIVARLFAVLLGLITIETLISLVFEIYRPRTKGQASRVVYESRLVGFLAQPEGIFTTFAHALDYQFGFKVSETWFYKFLERALGWMLLAQGVVLIISSSFVFIEPTEEALLERFGRPVEGRAVLKPGFHVKLPWPMDRVHRFKTEQIQSFTVGIVQEEHEEEEHEETLVWTIAHGKEEYNMLVASSSENQVSSEDGQTVPPVSFLAVSMPVQFKVRSLQDWAYNHSDAPRLLESIAYRETAQYLVSIDILEIMAVGRENAALVLKDRIQKQADDLKMGIDIVYVGLQDIHPPVQASAAFEQSVGARQDIQTLILLSEAFRAKALPLVEASATNMLEQAIAYRHRVSTTTEAESLQFAGQLKAYSAAPEIYKLRGMLNAFAKGSADARKYVITTTNTTDVVQIDLEDKIRTDLLDVQLDTETSGSTQ